MSCPQSSARANQDFRNLLHRIAERRYPETLLSLASYWLRTVYRKGYQRDEWRCLDALLHRELEAAGSDEARRRTLAAIRDSIHEDGLLKGEPPKPRFPLLPERRQPPQKPEVLAPYIVRLINEWLPREVARMLVEATEDEASDRAGIPALAAATALEQLLRREALPDRNLELLLDPVFSPHVLYPADYELLRDIVLLFLGRTDAPPFPILPAAFLCAASDSHLGVEFAEAVNVAQWSAGSSGEELQVPVPASRALEILREPRIRIASLVVTMDGRWWEAAALNTGDPNSITYRPGGRLEIDFSNDRPMVRMPWPENREHWSGAPSFPKNLAFFGRRWRVARWEQDAEGVWLLLASAGALPVNALTADTEIRLRRSRPASVDIAWASIEAALAQGLAARSGDPVERLRNEELIPLARALHALAECAGTWRLRTPDALRARLSSVAYYAGAVESEYGQVPWTILPKRVRASLQSAAQAGVFETELRGIFAGVPAQAEAAFPVLERWWSRRARAA